MDSGKIKSTDEILLILCESVQKVLKKATAQEITFSPLTQLINKTSLKPDMGCFTVFEEGLSGIVAVNFSAETALDLYRSHMINMHMPKEEMSSNYASDDVAGVLGELLNQAMGHFKNDIRDKLYTTIRYNPPKMLLVTQEITISIDDRLEFPQYRRVTFETESYRPFYLELGIEKTEFATLYSYQKEEPAPDVDDIFTEAQRKHRNNTGS